MCDIAHIYKQGVDSNMLYAWFSAMHTRVDIIILSAFVEKDAMSVVEEICREIRRLEQLGNCFDGKSELSKLNDGRLTRDSISPDLNEILDECDRWKETTCGLFDVGVEGGINLSGFLKGYALDKIRPILLEKHIDNALVNLGNSSVLALGSPDAAEKGWTVKNINGEQFVLHNECLTTSGNETESRKHIINPLTGEYIQGKRSVSVVTPSGAEGEVMSTVEFIRMAE